MTTTTLPSGTGIVSTYTYDDANRLTNIAHVKGGSTTVASVAYTLDDVGNRTQRVDQQGTHTYAYDDLHRLTSVTYPGPSTTTYDFDAFGNREEMVTGAGTTAYAYDDADRLTEVDPPAASPIAYTWDDNGNLTDRGSDEFEWDFEDRMAEATVNSVTSTFTYRGDGLRNSRTVGGGGAVTFTWDVASGLPVVLDDGSQQYVYGAGLTSMKQGGNWFYYLADGLGSTMAVVNASGVSQKSYTYDVYGEATPTGGLANEFDFAGQQTDATGLQYLRARYYDPETGTFLSREPLASEAGWTGQLFGYRGGNPVRFLDPSGLALVDSDTGGTNWCRHQCEVLYYWGDFSGDGGLIDYGEIWDRLKVGACDLRPGCVVSIVVTLPSLTGEYGLTLDMSRSAADSFKARPWSEEEFNKVKRFGQRFTDKHGRDVWLVQDTQGNYAWIVQENGGGKVWSLRKGQTEESLQQAMKEFKWK